MSTRAEVTFSGYAFSQIKKSRGQQKLVHNPKPEAKPLRSDFCWIIPIKNPKNRSGKLNFHTDPIARPVKLSDYNGFDSSSPQYDLLKYCHVAALEHTQNVYRLYYYGKKAKGVFRGDNLVVESIPLDDENKRFCGFLIYNENAFETELRDWKNYWDWVKNRNDARWVSQESGEMDFDGKNMGHCIRLLYSGINILEKGYPIIRFEGEKLQLLKDIRAGKYKWDFVMGLADELMLKVKEAKEKSKLPYEADKKGIDNLYREVYAMSLKK